MANNCLIKTLEYQTKLKQSGIPESIYYSIVSNFVNKVGRFPNLDEIANANSSTYITNLLHLDNNNSTSIDNILVTTNTNSIQEANVKLNDTYSDQEVEIMPLYNDAIVTTTLRPS